MKKIRVILALLMALLMLGGMFVAMADDAPGSMDVSPGNDEPTDEPDPTDEPGPTDAPTDEPGPTDEPTTEPTDSPTDEPTNEPTDEPTDEPTAEPSAEPTTEPTAEPTAEPTDEPDPEPPVSSTGGTDTSQGSATRPSTNMGGSIRQPSGSSRRPISGGSSQGSQSASGAPVEEGPQYVTFARVTQKSNAMSRTLFYSGAACVGTGVLGLIVLVVFMVRGRGGDDREEIFAEIEQAAVRQPQRPRQPQPQPEPAYEDDPYAQYDRQDYEYEDEDYEPQGGYRQDYGGGYDSPPPSLHRPEPEDLAVPVNGNLYTEEFELPPQQARYQQTGYQQAGYSEPAAPPKASMYTEEFEPPSQVPPSRGPIMPTQASMYTEEFSLPEEMPAARHYAEQRHAEQHYAEQTPVRRRPAPQPRPAQKVPPEQMDTTELLREILYGEDQK